MSPLSWLPGPIRELLRHVPTLLWEMVDWGSMTKDVTTLSGRLLSAKGKDEAKNHLAQLLPAGLRFADLAGRTEDKQLLGDVWLELYFRQLLSNGPMFLDLRASTVDGARDDWHWSPTNLWAEFTPGFALALGKLYDGFYLADDALFKQGLRETGLVDPQWPLADQEQMALLFKQHFGTADASPMRFQLSAFQASFQKVFSFLAEKKVHLSADFLHLGIMLVTLYMALESWGGTHDVARIYRQARTPR